MDRVQSGDGAAEVAPTTNGGSAEGLKVNGHASQEEQVKRIGVSEMDDVNLGNGKSMFMFIHLERVATVMLQWCRNKGKPSV